MRWKGRAIKSGKLQKGEDEWEKRKKERTDSVCSKRYKKRQEEKVKTNR